MGRNILVALLKSVVFAHIMQVIPAHDHRALHLHLGDDPCQDAASDAHVARERTLLVNVRTLHGLQNERPTFEREASSRGQRVAHLSGGLEAQTHVLHITRGLLRFA